MTLPAHDELSYQACHSGECIGGAVCEPRPDGENWTKLAVLHGALGHVAWVGVQFGLATQALLADGTLERDSLEGGTNAAECSGLIDGKVPRSVQFLAREPPVSDSDVLIPTPALPDVGLPKNVFGHRTYVARWPGGIQ